MNRRTIQPVLVVVAVVATVQLLPFLLTGHFVSVGHLRKIGFVWPAATYLFSFVGVWMTYIFSKSFIGVRRVGHSWLSELKHYLIGIGCCALIALSAAYYLGTHREDADPILGGGEVVVDYVPSDDQRVRRALVLFLALCIPTLLGMREGLAESGYEQKKTA